MRHPGIFVISVLNAIGLFCACILSAGAAPPWDDSLSGYSLCGQIAGRAEEMARQPFVEEAVGLPGFLRNLGYDDYREIRFRPEQSLWRTEGSPFTIRFFHRGFYFQRKVKINVVEDGRIRGFHYRAGLFDFGRNRERFRSVEQSKGDLGFAGFQVFYPLYGMEPREVAVFLGASYFRAVGRGQGYGLSARGLAVDTGLSVPEEFPFFREFWIERPRKAARSLTIHALLDGPSVTGAYRFIIRPGAATAIEIRAALFLRKNVSRLGIAPLTSMHYVGKCKVRPRDDYRPEVHDSDGLLVAAGSGEWLWRPLVNPNATTANSFVDEHPRGFGLLQRERDFRSYQDLEANYHLRPNAWVEPVGNWGKGAVQLVQIPSDSEINDNIAAFWVSDKPAAAGEKLRYEYRLFFHLDHPGRPPGARVVSTRTGMGGVHADDPDKRLFVIEFAGGLLNERPLREAEAVISASTGTIRNGVVQKNEHTGAWRVSFELIPVNDAPAELRCFLKSGADVLSETWTYLWTRR